MTDRISEIKQRCEAYYDTFPNVDRTNYAIGYNVVRIKSELTGDNYNEKFSELAAHAIRDIPYLLSELANRDAEVERLREKVRQIVTGNAITAVHYHKLIEQDVLYGDGTELKGISAALQESENNGND